MQKSFVLDANVLLHDPLSLFRFGDNEVVVPIVVIEELDQFKREMSERGRNAREVSRQLDHLRQHGPLTGGVPTPDGGRIRVHLSVDVPDEFPFLNGGNSADLRILALAWTMKNGGGQVVLVTKDTNLRIKAEAVGLHAVDYLERGGEIDVERLSYTVVDVDRSTVDALYADGKLDVERLNGAADLPPNACVLLRDAADQQHSGAARRQPDKAVLGPLRLPRQVAGIAPRNLEQKFALDLLLDPRVPLVSLAGKAGTGKTLLALAAGLMQTVDKKTYRRLLIARPIYPMGRDLGYLPGELDEKLRPWMQPIFDNLELLLGDGEGTGRHGGAHPVDYLVEQGLLEIEALTYIRGRSLPRQFMIVDEAQNLTPLEVKTVITRAGEDTKIVLTGDPDQIDNPYVDAGSNGLSYASQQLAGQPLAGTVVLTRGERSPLAELAADRL
jgi:PhoH-like ATPase